MKILVKVTGRHEITLDYDFDDLEFELDADDPDDIEDLIRDLVRDKLSELSIYDYDTVDSDLSIWTIDTEVIEDEARKRIPFTEKDVPLPFSEKIELPKHMFIEVDKETL